jgi:hypothetical protein
VLHALRDLISLEAVVEEYNYDVSLLFYFLPLTSSTWTLVLKYFIFFLYGSTALWTLAAFSVSLSYTQSVGLLGRGSVRRKAATYTQDNTNTE